jgi:hypothetical protein
MKNEKMVYREKFPVGSNVLIKNRQHLEEFQRTWKYHHPLEFEQLQYAGLAGEVEKVGFYHGGDELYSLKGAPGIWHGQCLSGHPSDGSDRHDQSMSEGKCPFKVGDTVIYKPTREGRGKIIMTDLSALEPDQKYKIVRIEQGCYVVPEGFEKSVAGGLYWTEFTSTPE